MAVVAHRPTASSRIFAVPQSLRLLGLGLGLLGDSTKFTKSTCRLVAGWVGGRWSDIRSSSEDDDAEIARYSVVDGNPMEGFWSILEGGKTGGFFGASAFSLSASPFSQSLKPPPSPSFLIFFLTHCTPIFRGEVHTDGAVPCREGRRSAAKCRNTGARYGKPPTISHLSLSHPSVDSGPPSMYTTKTGMSLAASLVRAGTSAVHTLCSLLNACTRHHKPALDAPRQFWQRFVDCFVLATLPAISVLFFFFFVLFFLCSVFRCMTTLEPLFIGTGQGLHDRFHPVFGFAGNFP